MKNIQIDDNSRNLLIFFTLTFIISWSIWFLAPLISFGDFYFLNYICLIGAFGPSLSAIIIASRLKSDRINNPKKKKWIIFCIIFIVSFISGLISLVLYPTIFILAIIILIVASIIASFLISGLYSSNSGISKLLKTIKGVKNNNIYLIIALCIPLFANLGGVFIYVILGGFIPPTTNIFLLFLLFTAVFPYVFFFGGPLNEEIGWRGFATPRMLEKYSPLITGLIIGVIWSIWHAPLHFNGLYGNGLLGFLMRFIYNIPFGIMFTWYFIKSQNNLLGAIILHASVNVYASFALLSLNVSIFNSLIYIIFTVIIIVHGKMWKKFPINN